MDDMLDSKRVKDVMLPLSEYAVVSEDATLRDALAALGEAQQGLPPEREPHRAVLVVDRNRKIVGKAGQLAFLKALEPKFSVLGDLNTLTSAGVTSESVSSMIDNLEFWQGSVSANCRRAASMKIKHFMTPAAESIDENAPLTEAIHKIVLWQTLSVLVTSRGKVIGILRLSDLFAEIAASIQATDD
ncbi:MAG: CBS domain-containing protein [Planctomycetota bacterium]